MKAFIIVMDEQELEAMKRDVEKVTGEPAGDESDVIVSSLAYGNVAGIGNFGTCEELMAMNPLDLADLVREMISDHVEA